MFKKISLIILGVVLWSYVPAQGPPIFTDTPVLLGLEGSGIRTFGKFISKENAKIYVQPLIVPYNITPRLLVAAVVPFVNKNPSDGAAIGGLGDMSAVAKFTVFQIDGKAKTFRIVAKLREIFPTGNSKSMPSLGAGIYQTMPGIVSGYITSKFGIYADIGYNITSGGATDNLLYNMAFAYPLLPQQYPAKQINIYLEFNGNYIVDTKANSLFVSPGLQWIMGRRVLVESGIQIPLNEIVPSGSKTKFMFLLGTRILIF